MQYVASISYGKDSLAMLHVIKDILHKPLDRIVTAEVWATDTIQADLPPMVEFKDKADKIIFERWGIKVDRMFATDKSGNKLTYEKMFYRIPAKRDKKKLIRGGGAEIRGFPIMWGPWCNSLLKRPAIHRLSTSTQSVVSKTEIRNGKFSAAPDGGREKIPHINYIGIAADEPKRIERHKDKKDVLMPLVDAGWTEAMCRKWCEENGLLSPLYATSNRGGCWFCHNQSLEQLRLLRHNYPELWALLLKWDIDSPISFHADGRTVHDIDKRFQLEDEGYYNYSDFRWDSLKAAQMNIDQFL